MYEQVKERGEKGYARLVTNFGALNFEVRRRVLRPGQAPSNANPGEEADLSLRRSRTALRRRRSSGLLQLLERASSSFSHRRAEPDRPLIGPPSVRSSLARATTRTSSSTASSRASWCVPAPLLSP